ncbi:MAG: hypothetical protein K2Q09_01705, partial [Phycisphaerales bacterium]|nr:hypothetical protein [Phycisphaerales bacterium]
GMDPSYRVLVRAAALKAVNPERVHVLLANHELSQIAGRGVMKNGVNCVKAFNDAVEYVFGDDAPGVHDALGAFIRSMPLALRCTPVVAGEGAGGDVLCAHSLPADLDGFDLGVLERALTEADYQPRTGAAHAMTWGRNQLAETVGALAKAWGVAVFVLGHEEAEEGWRRLEPCGVILNSDHERGAVCRVDLSVGASLEGVLSRVEALSQGWG